MPVAAYVVTRKVDKRGGSEAFGWHILVGVRQLWIASLAACASVAEPVVAPAPVAKPVTLAVRIDPLDALAHAPPEHAWIVPGLAQLELGGASIQAPSGADELDVALLDDSGSMVRVAVHTDALAFVVWTERARLLGVIAKEQAVSARQGGDVRAFSPDAPIAILHPGAHVRRLAARDHWLQIRYLGALEIDGWVPAEVVVDRGQPGGANVMMPTGMQTLSLMHGTGDPRRDAVVGAPARDHGARLLRRRDPPDRSDVDGGQLRRSRHLRARLSVEDGSSRRAARTEAS